MSPLTPEQLAALDRLRALFRAVPDARQPGKVAYALDEVLMMAFCAMLSDCGDFTEMEVFAETHEAWLRSFLSLPNGTLSHDVFRNVFMALRPAALLEILASWGAELSGRHIAIDGKALRGTRDEASGKCLVRVVRAWVDEHSLSAGQVVCAEKSNELEAIPRLWIPWRWRAPSSPLTPPAVIPPSPNRSTRPGRTVSSPSKPIRRTLSPS